GDGETVVGHDAAAGVAVPVVVAAASGAGERVGAGRDALGGLVPRVVDRGDVVVVVGGGRKPRVEEREGRRGDLGEVRALAVHLVAANPGAAGVRGRAPDDLGAAARGRRRHDL